MQTYVEEESEACGYLFYYLVCYKSAVVVEGCLNVLYPFVELGEFHVGDFVYVFAIDAEVQGFFV